MTTATTPSDVQEDRKANLFAIGMSLCHMGLNGHLASEDVRVLSEAILRLRKEDHECAPKRGAPLPDWSL